MHVSTVSTVVVRVALSTRDQDVNDILTTLSRNDVSITHMGYPLQARNGGIQQP